MSKINNLTGKKFGRLKVVEYYGNSKNRKALWLCQCECGNTKIILGNSLTSKATVSCGCYNKEKALTEPPKKYKMCLENRLRVLF